MSTEIGQVNINLRLSLAQLSNDVKSGNDAVRAGMEGIKTAASSASREASGSLALLGETIGISMPRHLRTFIAGLPGVGAALSSAFTGVAVLALIELIVKVVEKIQDYRAKLAENAAAWTEIGKESDTALRALDEQILGLQVRIDELNKDHVAALRDSLALINAQTLDTLGQQFDKVTSKADAAFVKMRVGWFESLMGEGNNAGVQNVKETFDILLRDIEKMKEAGNMSGIGTELGASIDTVKAKLQDFYNLGGNKTIQKALQDELSVLQDMAAYYDKLNVAADKKTDIAIMQDRKRATAEAAAEAKKLAEMLAQVMAVADKLKDTGVSPIAKDFQAMRMSNIDVAPTATYPIAPGGKSPLYGGSKEAKDLLNLQTDQNEQLRMASELYSATRTSSEEYAHEMEVLNTLLASGAISQDTYNKAVSEAKNKYDDLTKGLNKIGDTIGRDIEQAALFGGSWTKAFQDILAEVLKTIVQLTILKGLQEATASHGGGGGLGFLTSIVGGLTGHAGGGTVVAGHGYLVGENGPEPFFPTTAGTILPNESLRAGGGNKTEIHAPEFHFHGVTDMDSFKQSKAQISAAMLGAMSRDAQRNG